MINGIEVTRARVLQLAIYQASQGRAHVAIVKNIAIDMFATKVRHFGPTYSKTARKTIISIGI